MTTTMRIFLGCAVLIAAGALNGCGSDKSSAAGNSARATSSASAAAGNATAAEVAEEARGKVKCPARVKSAARDPQAPADDVVGVRPGMSYEEAANVVMCTHDLLVVSPETSRGFRIETFGQKLRQGFNARFAADRVQKTSKQIMQEMQDRAMARSSNRVTQDVQPGQSKWYVATIGIPGEERVISAAREEWFEADRNPSIASVEQALMKKYGAPTDRRQARDGDSDLRWAYDPLGRLITETSPLFHQCNGTADPDGGSNFSPDCGVVVAAHIRALRDNPQLSQYLQVGVVDQAAGYEQLTATEEALRSSEMQRRAAQVEAADKNADAPIL